MIWEFGPQVTLILALWPCNVRDLGLTVAQHQQRG